MQAVIGKFYKTEEKVLKALQENQVIIQQGNNYIIISKRQTQELKILNK